jgi:valacyclovir hydrolase
MAWFEHRDCRIYYEEAGSGSPVLVIPGVTLSIEDLTALRQTLAPKHRVIAADPPGSGRSGPQPRQYTASYFENDSCAFLDLLDELAASPAHVVGFSDGGEYALLMAELKPAAVRSIVAWGAVGQIAVSSEMLDAVYNLIDNPIPELKGWADNLKAQYGEASAKVMTQSAAKAWEAIVEAGGNISLAGAGEITCPALLIAGEHDDMAPPALVSDLARAMQNAQFIEVKGAGHAVHRERPEWLAQTIVKWLADH